MQKVGFRREARRAAPEAHLLTGRENLLDVCSKHQEGLLGGLHFLIQNSAVCGFHGKQMILVECGEGGG